MRFLVPADFVFWIMFVHLMIALVALVFVYKLRRSLFTKIIYMIVALGAPFIGSIIIIALCYRQTRLDWHWLAHL
jgi:hypothetical protein